MKPLLYALILAVLAALIADRPLNTLQVDEGIPSNTSGLANSTRGGSTNVQDDVGSDTPREILA